MTRWFAVAFLTVALIVPATTGAAQSRDETGEALGPLQAPPGGKAYRVSWNGFWNGFVEVSLDADGKARMTTGGPSGAPAVVELQPNDLDAFETELSHSPFSATAEHPSTVGCADECSYVFLTVATGGARKTLPSDPHAETVKDSQDRLHSGRYTISEAADELVQLAAARSGDLSGRPAPWWTLDGVDHPDPAIAGQRAGCASGDTACAHMAWIAQLTALGLTDLRRSNVAYPGESFYRLIWFSKSSGAKAVTYAREPSHCGIVMRQGLDVCQEHVGVVTPSRPTPRAVPRAQADAFEHALYAAGFATAASDPPGRCAGDAWVLEAYIGGRYRYVAGSACDPRGLGAPVAQLRALGDGR
ncbi:MAG TPA: hypothetical protein VGL66_06055 [Caulobacteraceae bacterium]